MNKINFAIGMALLAIVIAIASALPIAASAPSLGGTIVGTPYPHGLSAGSTNQWTVDSSGNMATVGSFVQTITTGLNVFLSASAFNNIIQGVSGYSTTYNTAVAATTTLTAAQWCGTTNVLIPVGATSSVGQNWPNATTTYTACGVTANGSWETQIVENDSSFPYIIATSSTGFTFLYTAGATTTTTGTKWPVQVPASTTATFIGIPTSTSTWNILVNQYAHTAGQ